MASDSKCSLAVNSINTSASINPEPTSDSTLESPYRPLGPTQIRIVEILPGDFEQPIQIILKTVDLEDKPAYDALSYVWNPTDGTIDVSKTLHPAVIKGVEDFPIKITANLDAAIRYLRQGKSDPSALWIDALCINQDRALERNHQVGLMSRIYSSANNVLIWLGPPSHNSEFAFEALLTGKLDEHSIDRFITAMELLLRRDWFGRLWIAQELTLSQQIPNVCHGSQVIDWKTFTQYVEIVKDRINGVGDPACRQYLRTFTIANIKPLDDPFAFCIDYDAPHHSHLTSHPPALVARATTVLTLRDLRNAGFRARFGQRLLHTVYLKATDPRDRVYGLLGFSTFHTVAITPNYNKGIDTVYAEAARAVLLEDLHDYLEFFDRFSVNVRDRQGKSWFPDMKLGLTPRSGPDISPPRSVIQAILDMAFTHFFPVLVSRDLTQLFTMGKVLGTIVDEETAGLDDEDNQQLSILNFARRHSSPGKDHGFSSDTKCSNDDIVSAIMGHSRIDVMEKRSMVAMLNDYCESKLNSRRWILDQVHNPAYQSFEELLNSHGRFTIFVTDTRLFGVVPHWYARGRSKRLYLAGLFGMGVPFILEPAERTHTYKMVYLAYVGNHVLGNKSLAEVAPLTDWNDTVMRLGLEKFIII